MHTPSTPLTLLILLPAVALAATAPTSAQDATDFVTSHVEAHRSDHERVAKRIWELAEVGYQEDESSALLQERVAAAGFRVESGVAGMPTAFVAEWGSGGPVIGILAEFDALPGITNAAVPQRSPQPEKGAGHACGHHLFGTGSTAAALAVKAWLEESGHAGTVRLYGTPAEEGGAGKVYMVREGLFDDVDVVLHWHAGDANSASPSTSLANKSAKFRFTGRSSHAAGAPHRGRSALDGVMAMNFMVNMIREHVPQETRIHYVITAGGNAPNVVPDFAEVYYYVRHPDPATDQGIFERVVDAAEAGALGTGTEMEYEIIHGLYNVLPNETLSRLMWENLNEVGGVQYDARERAFAESIRSTLGGDAPPIESAAEILPFDYQRSGMGSTDVGDVSWKVPTVGLRTATWVPGTSAHSWQAVAAGGTSIGIKGMINAAKTLAMTAVDLYRSPEIVAEAKAEWEEKVPDDFVYEPLLGDRPPPLDYRVNPGGGGGQR
ncbi:MAG: amidohydrolase [Gemmatimonadetes bacterium]|nr:amidohydrolase [Gemmatimonadota bacterium]NIR78841.1 amidohydrolase [Gemmatimonadota bacterium]NIT87479.1 amidohydrolase [Gemmatimonadota bacterium]NIU31338.1 amidohydrolase [Gemmatimonadota bacterium]NIU36026.1 amidohydrolase [Gemmatimonadota bacterium]